MPNEEIEFPTIDSCREMIVKFMQDILAPQDITEILKTLQDNFIKYIDCGCGRCILHSMNVAEACILIEESAKIVPKENRNGVAGLLYRLHESREESLRHAMDRAETIVFDAGRNIAKSVAENIPQEHAELILTALWKVLQAPEQDQNCGEDLVDAESKPDCQA